MAIVDVRKVIQELVVPELQEIKSDIKVIKSDLRNLDKRMDSLEREMLMGFNNLQKQIDVAIELRERIAALEAASRH